MSHTLRGTVPVSHEYSAEWDDSQILDHVRYSVRVVTRERQCEALTEPRLVDTRHTPDYVIYTYECETTEPTLGDVA